LLLLPGIAALLLWRHIVLKSSTSSLVPYLFRSETMVLSEVE
jgi:hypothetical protein